MFYCFIVLLYLWIALDVLVDWVMLPGIEDFTGENSVKDLARRSEGGGGLEGYTSCRRPLEWNEEKGVLGRKGRFSTPKWSQ